MIMMPIKAYHGALDDRTATHSRRGQFKCAHLQGMADTFRTHEIHMVPRELINGVDIQFIKHW